MIGGNITGYIQTKTTTKNDIGEKVSTWVNAAGLTNGLKGWLDLSQGDSKYNNFNAKIQESTHVFICNYNATLSALKPEECRMVIRDKVYDVLLIDNPMEMDQQNEIYLRYVGGQ